MTDIDREIETIREIVRDTLKEDERARREDNWLIWKVFRKFCPIFIPFDAFKSLPSCETITRCRRELNSKGLFLPDDPKVLKRRMRRERGFRDHYGKEIDR